MEELGIFLDESGSDGLRDRYYLLALVLHEQADAIDEGAAAYRSSLAAKGLPSIPFHASPLLTATAPTRACPCRTGNVSSLPSACSSAISPCATHAAR